ncbi:MAG: type II toxin-antitoxin system HicB family antitoxin [Chloroflexi bacterium]|nr:type II toxin-antitoxin system HicB family antitoxin [Chloroflexota bacterium]
MATAEAVTGTVHLLGVAYREEGQFVSHCPQLGVASCGDTAEEALQNLDDALGAYLAALEETGELLRVFKERHIRVDLPSGSEPDVQMTIPKGKIVQAFEHKVKLAAGSG